MPFLKRFLLEKEKESKQGEEQRERKNPEADSLLSMDPNVKLDSMLGDHDLSINQEWAS